MSTSPKHMINAQAFFSRVVKRLFSGRVQEGLGELLQNSRRAGASRFDVRFPAPGVCVFEDNGHGIASLEDLSKLLVLADSRYLDPLVEVDQAPMGIGLYALFTNERVQVLRIESKRLRFELVPRLWLDDLHYLESWEERVEWREREDLQGFRLTIEGDETLMGQLRACLLSTADNSYSMGRYVRFRDHHNPICGYEGLLEVYLEGERVAVMAPAELTLPGAEIVATYQGNEVRITPFAPGMPGLATNWYGQIVLDGDSSQSFQAYLVVRQGRPVTPQAPTRKGLIQDEARAALYRWIEDQIFSWVCTQEAPTAPLVKQLYAINRQRAAAECPFAVVQRWKPLARDYAFDSHDRYACDYHARYYCYDSSLERDGKTRPPDDQESDRLGPELVVRKVVLQDLQLLEERVTCALPAGHPTQPYAVQVWAQQDPSRSEVVVPAVFELGLPGLLRAAGIEAYRPVEGVDDALVGRLWWKPGPWADRYHTTEPGEWAIGRGETPGEGLPSLSWQPLTDDEVFVASETDSWGVANVAWIIGLSSSDKMVPFLKRCAHAAFSRDDEDGDASEESYDETLAELIRSYLPDTIAESVWLSCLPRVAQKFLPPGYDARAATWRFLYSKPGGRLLGVRLSYRDGYKKELKFS